MNSKTTHKLEFVSKEELLDRGFVVLSYEQLANNMDKRLKKLRGEENASGESFLLRHNYKNKGEYCHS